MSVCCATLLSNKLVGSDCGQTRSNDTRGRARRPNGKGRVGGSTERRCTGVINTVWPKVGVSL